MYYMYHGVLPSVSDSAVTVLSFVSAFSLSIPARFLLSSPVFRVESTSSTCFRTCPQPLGIPPYHNHPALRTPHSRRVALH
ncbi:hypothetical protein FA95DRAFT_1423960 [Auriscalpium vulgare]|uniref:Uncharacterized protein n=1 Tax=Auriscalpium vulgare TaxID=40419 RepID=A0ACB8RQ21_9AGAM|nr:hypothetical protein FA95DRAFT_1423960 [Auriscalpium vulgare]